jgi:long-chain acyl-CoA synthetase
VIEFNIGDIGEWQPNGSLKIIDRKKNIFKLAQGEYIAVEHLEMVYGMSMYVEQIWVYGNSFESSLVAVVVPNEECLRKWASANGRKGTFADLCIDKKVQQFLLEDLISIGRKQKVIFF